MTSGPITAIETPTVDGAPDVKLLSGDEIAAYFTALADPNEVQYRLTLADRTSGSLHFTQSPDFLNEIKPVIDQGTADSKSILQSIIRGTRADVIRQQIALQQLLGDIDYDHASRFLAAFDQYVGRGMVKKPKKILADQQKVTALYRVADALRTVQPNDVGTDRHPLVYSMRDDELVWIRDSDLLAFILDNAAHGDAIAEIIATAGTARVPEIQFLLDGGTTAVSDGAL